MNKNVVNKEHIIVLKVWALESHGPGYWLASTYLISQTLRSLICKMGITIASTAWIIVRIK